MHLRFLSSCLVAGLSLCGAVSAGVLPADGLANHAKRAVTTKTSSVKPSSTSSKVTSSSTKTSSSSSTKIPSTSSSTVKIPSTPTSLITSSTAKISSTSASLVSSTTIKVADSSCTNGPFTRSCWGNGFSIATDYDVSWPTTGKVVSYSLEITNTTLSPDGFVRDGFAINGQFPGPTLYASWGDTLQVTVKNSLTHNGTGIHWHGIRQANSSNMDGTNGITECPIAPGDSKTYTFHLTQFGTTWYHSHFSAQYGDGIWGTLQIAGPATENYDIDLGVLPISDWYYASTSVNELIVAQTGPIAADNGLINGTMISSYGGKYNTISLTKGKRYRLRLVNTAVDNNFKFSLDSHNFTVIQADFVPVVPYEKDWIFIAIGERYDVVFTADQAVDNYWFRAEVQNGGCGTNDNNGNIKSIFSYTGATAGNPTSTASTYTNACVDESGLTPYVPKNVPADTFTAQSAALDINLVNGVTSNGANIVQWTLNGTAIKIDWEEPTLQYVKDNNNSYPSELNIIELPQVNAWSFWIIQSQGAVQIPHPIHLHGHDFYLMGTGAGVFSDPTVLDYTNPMRRDVALLPASGWLVIGFITDNPGAWLMHCHIAWHVGEGLAVQFLERKSEITSLMDLGTLEPTCSKWDAYYNNDPEYLQTDSGL